MKKIAVVYLCRFGNPPQASRAFLKSLRRFRAGMEFDLVYLLKGFPENRTDPALSRMRSGLPCAVEEIKVSDEFFMINALLEGAAQISHDSILPLGSWSRMLADDWLASFVSAFDRIPGCVVAGATGSYESLDDATPFPNVHIRTTGFLINRETFLGLERGPLRTKFDNNYFEAGPNGMTRQILAQGGQPVVVGKGGQCWLQPDWPHSRTFRSAQQENLLIEDNQTYRYEARNFKERRCLTKAAWNDESLAQPGGLGRRLWYLFRRRPR